jgi:hypothetical protein
MSKVIVCDDFQPDPLAQVALGLPSGKAPRVVMLSDFLDGNGFAFDPETGQMRRNAPAREGGAQQILDRVVEVSQKTVAEIDGAKDLLQRGQVYACYEAVLNERGLVGAERQYSTVGRLLPLPTQWRLVGQAGLPVTTPRFLYGYGPMPVDTSTLERPTYKSPYDLYHWRANRPEEEGEIWDQFVVESPEGAPVLVWFLGDEYVVNALRKGEEQIAHDVSATIVPLSRRIAELFAANLGEVLWYVNGAEIMFAAFSHFLKGASLTPEFSTRAVAFLEDYFDDEDREPALS